MTENLYHLKNKEVSEHKETTRMDHTFLDLIVSVQDAKGISPEDRDQIIMELRWARVRVSKYANEMYVLGGLHEAADEAYRQINQEKTQDNEKRNR